MSAEQTITAEPAAGAKIPVVRWIWPLVIIAIVVALDQYLKYWVKHNMVMHTEKPIIGNWFLFHFTENNGMAFGIEFAGKYGKLILTTFRIGVAIFGFWYLFNAIRKHLNTGFLICIALILAGAIGNIIDCLFYGVWYKEMNEYDGGYMFGRVVDMLYFPIIETHYPSWFPFKAGEPFTFFSPVFNLADAAISTGVITIILFQKRFFKKIQTNENVGNFEEAVSEPPASNDDNPPSETLAH